MRADLDAGWTDALRLGLLAGVAVLVLVLPPPRQAPSGPARAEFGAAQASDEVRRLAQWVLASADHGGRPFAILDKRGARVYVFAADGRLRGATPALLGLAVGDESVPGIGQRPIAQVRPEERTTPAGRFVSEPGRNSHDEEVLWIDYDAAVSMHRVRLNNPAEHRLERLAAADAGERRISYGCVNLPAAFFEQVVWPSFGPHGGVVYVLPEVKPLAEVFPALATRPRAGDERGAASAG